MTDYFIWCDDLPGFGVRIQPGGVDTWSSIAPMGAPGRQRSAARPADPGKRLVGKPYASRPGGHGENRAGERATPRAALTLRELCERRMRAAEKGLILGEEGSAKKASTLMGDRSKIDRHILPLLDARRGADLSRADVTCCMRDAASWKTALVEKTSTVRWKTIVEGGPGAATALWGCSVGSCRLVFLHIRPLL
jgi:hypothetical protein